MLLTEGFYFRIMKQFVRWKNKYQGAAVSCTASVEHRESGYVSDFANDAGGAGADVGKKRCRKKMSDMPDMIVEQAAVLNVKTAYLNLGMDVDRIQIQYILITGGKMITCIFGNDGKCVGWIFSF